MGKPKICIGENKGADQLRSKIRVAKTKALISFAFTAKLICAFVFAYADFLVFPFGGSKVKGSRYRNSNHSKIFVQNCKIFAIALLSKYKISSLYPSSVTVQAG